MLGSFYSEANPSLQGSFRPACVQSESDRIMLQAKSCTQEGTRNRSKSWTGRFTDLSGKLPLLLRASVPCFSEHWHF